MVLISDRKQIRPTATSISLSKVRGMESLAQIEFPKEVEYCEGNRNETVKKVSVIHSRLGVVGPVPQPQACESLVSVEIREEVWYLVIIKIINHDILSSFYSRTSI